LASGLGLWFLVAGYSIVIVFFVVQRLLRRTASAKSLRGGAYDRGNMLLVGTATGVGLLLPAIVNALALGLFQINVVWGLAALVLMLSGFGIRVWAATALGRFYTTTLMIAEDHKVVTAGPYSRIRHPGYLGEILLWSGFGILSSSLVALIVLPVMMIAVYLYRIRSEESMLVQALGDDYTRYRRKTRRLVPFVY